MRLARRWRSLTGSARLGGAAFGLGVLPGGRAEQGAVEGASRVRAERPATGRALSFGVVLGGHLCPSVMCPLVACAASSRAGCAEVLRRGRPPDPVHG